MKLLTADQVRELDRQAIEEIGIPGVVLMENAGRGAAELINDGYGDLWPGPVLVVAGKGNNGGDGFVIARHLMNMGWDVITVALAPQEAIKGDAAINLEVLLRSEGEVFFAPEQQELAEFFENCYPPELVVDALLGTGLASEVLGSYALAIDWINASGLPVVAVDVPSGVDATTGAILGDAVCADLTVTFVAPKVGLLVYPAAGYVGDLATVDIGMPAHLLDLSGDEHLLVDEEVAASLLPQRPSNGHKGTFGHLLVVAGSTGKTGAAALTAQGGQRIGCGLVTLACPASVHDILEIKLSEAMTVAVDEVDGALSLQALEPLRSLWAGKQALAIGPGLGLGEETGALVRRMVRECPVPLVIDADGLNALGAHPEFLKECDGLQAVLTPHPGEMARLLGVSVAEVEADRIGAARSFATTYGVTLLLKGARTVIAFTDGRVCINRSGNSGMASGGTGDVLTGIIGGLLAQGLAPEQAAVLGAWLHGAAGDQVADRCGESGMTATDLLAEIPSACHNLSIPGEEYA